MGSNKHSPQMQKKIEDIRNRRYIERWAETTPMITVEQAIQYSNEFIALLLLHTQAIGATIESILATLDFRDTPNWIPVLKKKWRPNLEKQFHEYEEAIDAIVQRYMPGNSHIAKHLKEIPQPYVSDVQDGIKEAISGDGGVKLLAFAEVFPGSGEIFKDFELTLARLQNTQMQRSTAYIGARMLELEQAGTKGTRAQWQAIYRELQWKFRQTPGAMSDFESAAWDYLIGMEPHNLKGQAYQTFESGLRMMKKRVKDRLAQN